MVRPERRASFRRIEHSVSLSHASNAGSDPGARMPHEANSSRPKPRITRHGSRNGNKKAREPFGSRAASSWSRGQDLNLRPPGCTLSQIICTGNTMYKHDVSRLQGIFTFIMYHDVSPCLCIIHFHTYDYTYEFSGARGFGSFARDTERAHLPRKRRPAEAERPTRALLRFRAPDQSSPETS